MSRSYNKSYVLLISDILTLIGSSHFILGSIKKNLQDHQFSRKAVSERKLTLSLIRRFRALGAFFRCDFTISIHYFSLRGFILIYFLESKSRIKIYARK